MILTGGQAHQATRAGNTETLRPTRIGCDSCFWGTRARCIFALNRGPRVRQANYNYTDVLFTYNPGPTKIIGTTLHAAPDRTDSPAPEGDGQVGSLRRETLKRSLCRMQHRRQLRVDGRKAVDAHQRPQRGSPLVFRGVLAGKGGRNAGAVSEPQQVEWPV